MSERFTLFFYVQIKPRGEGQMVPLLQFLGSSNGSHSLPLTMPKLSIQPDAAGHQMNVVVVRVAVPRH